MKRLLSIVALVTALTLGTGSASAHTITVTGPDGEVVTTHDLATGTPRIFDTDYNVIARPDDAKPTNRSAASHGTNTSCEAVPVSSPVNITGGTCPKD